MSQNCQTPMRLERHSPEAQEGIESSEVSEGAPKWESPSAVGRWAVDICRLSACYKLYLLMSFTTQGTCISIVPVKF